MALSSVKCWECAKGCGSLEGLLLAAPPWTWVSDGSFALRRYAQAQHFRSIIISLASGGA